MPSYSEQIREVIYNNSTVKYFSPNATTDWRVDTFHTKEPSTVSWLSSFLPEDIFYDVGANVGMYSIFAAVHCQCQVFAFEPESQNFSLLCKNIYLNSLCPLVTPLCVAISDNLSISSLNLSQFDWDGGGSCHSFGQEVGFNLSPRVSPFKQSVVGLSIDQLHSLHKFPSPNHLKIDVDGFEHLVINGATQLLSSTELKSICIELNTNLPQHNRVIDCLVSHGFFYQSDQIYASMRKSGPFKGCAEFIFYRAIPFGLTINTPLGSSHPSYSNNVSNDKPSNAFLQPIGIKKDFHFDAFKYAAQKIWETELVSDPFPFIYINDLFPSSYYSLMASMFPNLDEMSSLSDIGRISYKQERYVSIFNDEGFSKLSGKKYAFWARHNDLLSSDFFTKVLISKFLEHIDHDVIPDNSSSLQLNSDSLLVRDLTSYSIGPHTDMTQRLISFLYYMPDNQELERYGTSVYKSKDPEFLCPGGPHYEFSDFERIGTAPFLPNSVLIFVRTPKSFHGVEPILESNIERKLLISNLRRY